MDRARFLIKSIGRKPVLVILLSVLLLTTALPQAAWSQAAEADKHKVGRRVAKEWVQVGAKQYKRGFYEAAEQSLLRAQDYQEYLSAAEREKLNELLEKTYLAVLEKTQILEHIQKADELVKQGELIKAKAHLKRVKNDESLTKEERKLITEGLNKINIRIEDKLFSTDVEPLAILEGKRTRKAEIKMIPELMTDKDSYIGVINRKRNILHGHVQAVVNDAVAKGQDYISQGDFDKAREVVEIAARTGKEPANRENSPGREREGSEITRTKPIRSNRGPTPVPRANGSRQGEKDIRFDGQHYGLSETTAL